MPIQLTSATTNKISIYPYSYLPDKKLKNLFSNINTLFSQLKPLLLWPISATKNVGFACINGISNHKRRKSQEKNKKKTKKNQSKASACLQQTSGGGRIGSKNDLSFYVKLYTIRRLSEYLMYYLKDIAKTHKNF
jgi:hypothetical protein